MSHRPQGPAADATVQEKLRDNERVLSGLEREQLLSLMQTKWGRAQYYRIVFELCHLEEPSYAASGQYMAFLEGRRDIALTLKREALEVCPDLWILMLQERVAESAARQAAHKQALTAGKDKRA